jgi:hypothetical protein
MSSPINHGSVISIGSIGEGENALVCKTINQQCCRTGMKKRGEWYYPNLTKVLTMGKGQRFYRNRSDDGEVILNQRQNPESTSSPGLYCCVIPDSIDFCNIYQRICVNLGKFAV